MEESSQDNNSKKKKKKKKKFCSRPGCDQPGPSLCGSCRLVGYCCRTCQVEDWPRHKETDCQGHLRKIGMSHLLKARGFHRDNNWVQSLRHSDLALVKLKQLNDRPIENIDSALGCKFSALNFMGQKRESLECAQERYCLYLTSHTHPPAIEASFNLIESCLRNEEYQDAELYARTTWETITLSRDSHIPDNQRQHFTARGAYYLALSMLHLAQHGDIPPEANQTVGQEAIGLARIALEIQTQLHGTEHPHVANAMCILADALAYFNNIDDDEVLRLYEQSIEIHSRVDGSSTLNVGVFQHNLGDAYKNRAKRARAENDLDRELINLELSLSHCVDAVRIFRARNHTEKADESAQAIVEVEEKLRQCTIARTVAAATAPTVSAPTGPRAEEPNFVGRVVVLQLLVGKRLHHNHAKYRRYNCN